MKAVMISIKPKYCRMIASGEKTLEIRKSYPNLGVPFKAYIYCTKDRKQQFWKSRTYAYVDDRSHNYFDRCGNGMVVGEFVCDSIEILNNIFVGEPDYHMPINGNACLDMEVLEDYGKGKSLYGWHISDLKIYENPKKLSEFSSGSSVLEWKDEDLHLGWSGMKRPPQSWCYVEEMV